MMDRLPGLHALRGAAAFAVLVHHLNDWVGRDYHAVTTPPGPGLGWAGVDVFFVLSGFLMVWTTRGRAGGLGDVARFLVERAGRIYPTWWVATAAAFGLSALAPALLPVGPACSLVCHVALWPEASRTIIHPGWTLIFEVMFYAIFALALFLAPRLRGLYLAAWAIILCCGAIAFAGVWRAPIVSNLINPLALEFLMGAGLAILVARGVQGFARAALMMGALALPAGAFAAGRILTDGAMMWDEFGRVLLVGAPAALLVYAAAILPFTPGARLQSLALWLGDRSYALYVVHWPIAAAVLGLGRAGAGDQVWVAILSVMVAGALSLATADVVHRGVERPSRDWARKAARALTRGLTPERGAGHRMTIRKHDPDGA